MGYYDDFDHYPKHRKRGGFLQGFLGAIIGGLLVIAMLPTLYEMGYLQLETPNQNRDALEEQTTQGSNNNPLDNRYRQTVTVDVNTGIADAVASVEDSVVGVVNLQKASDFWSRSSEVIQAGTGSGVIFERTGSRVRVVTNNHVVEGATEVEVVFSNGERVKAEVNGTDILTDLAVLTVDLPEGLDIAPVVFGNSETIKTGEPAIAIGNPLGLEFSRTVTVGVISSTERSIPQDIDGDGVTDWEMDVIQTDAAINPGNSGGALINIAGQLVGINSAKISQVGIEGMGFSIPINEATPIISDLLEYGVVKRPLIGIQPKNLQEIEKSYWSNTLMLPEDVLSGVVVIEVTPGGPADTAGIQELDVIIRLDDLDINTSLDLRKFLYKQKNVGDEVKVTFYRDGKIQTATVTLEELNPIR